MNRLRISVLYLKVSSFFLLLVLLVSIFPAVTSAGIKTYREMSLGNLGNTYLFVRFQYNTPPSRTVFNLKPGGLTIDAPLITYRNFTDSGHPPLLGEVVHLLEQAGAGDFHVYGMYALENGYGIIVPLRGEPRDADCLVARGSSTDFEGGTNYMIRLMTPVGVGAIYHNATIRSVKRLHPRSEEDRVLLAVLSEYEGYCLIGGNFYRNFIDAVNSVGGVENLSMKEFLLVIPGRKFNASAIYRILYEKFAPRGWYPEVGVITSQWVIAHEEKGKPLWRYLWQYLVLLLPLIPAMLVILGREKSDERKMKELILVHGGDALFLELITAGVVLGGSAVASLYFGAKYGFIITLLLVLFLFLKNFIAGSRREVGRLLLVALFFATAVPSALTLLEPEFRRYAAMAFASPFMLSGDVNLYWGALIFAFHYLPHLLLSIAAGAFILLLLDLRGGIEVRASARILIPSLLSLLVLLTYTGFVLSLPAGSLYSAATDGSYGATITVSFPNSIEDRVQTLEAYNTTVSLLRSEGVEFATVWSAGKVYRANGLSWNVFGDMECYDDDMVQFVREASTASSSASRFYRLLTENRDRIMAGYAIAQDLGVPKGGNAEIDLYLGDKTYRIRGFVSPQRGMGRLAMASCDLIRNQVQNFTPIPETVYIKGNRRILDELRAKLSKYGEDVEVWSMEEPAGYFMDGLGTLKGTLPFALSGLLMPLTAIILGLRDRERLEKLKFLLGSLGGSCGKSNLPLLALLPALFLSFLILKDGLSFYSLGFVTSRFFLLLVPALGMGLAPVLYAVTIVNSEKEVI
ncbi:hypothetical protein [Thermococcus sp. AM4]|uniref:hypothetical protein n=1 Tax=Thermococcus sp. (strain AM4) TaxID=246969 RepID=UPI0011D1BAEA|nr:hypothetical protein [Thermococcus sp. AM4]